MYTVGPNIARTLSRPVNMNFKTKNQRKRSRSSESEDEEIGEEWQGVGICASESSSGEDKDVSETGVCDLALLL